MKMKMVMFNTCAMCPHIIKRSGTYVCNEPWHSSFKPIPWTDIPDWCPLEDAPTKSAVLSTSSNTARNAIALDTIEKVLRCHAEALADMKREDPIEEVMAEFEFIAEQQRPC